MSVRSMSAAGLAIVWVLVFAAGTPAEARNRKRSWEFGVFAGEMLFDVPLLFSLGERGDYDALQGTRDSEFFGLRLGYNFTPHWEVEFTHDDTSTEDNGQKEAQRDIISDQITVNYNFLTTTERQIYPYVTGGIARLVSKLTVFSDSEQDDTTALVLGGGFRMFLSKTLSLRVDGRWKSYNEQIDFDDLLPREPATKPLAIDDRFTNFEITVGLHGIIGGQK